MSKILQLVTMVMMRTQPSALTKKISTRMRFHEMIDIFFFVKIIYFGFTGSSGIWSDWGQLKEKLKKFLWQLNFLYSYLLIKILDFLIFQGLIHEIENLIVPGYLKNLEILSIVICYVLNNNFFYTRLAFAFVSQKDSYFIFFLFLLQ